ncbi:MAG: recombination regulator RecX [Clostridiales bacterium]|nr:recombination regulator RecX [Clostridiales bacterium]
MRILEVKQVNNKGKLLVLTDEVGTFPLYRKEADAFHIEEGAELSVEDWERLCSDVLIKRAKKRALYLLEQQDRTEFQLRKKLREDRYPDSIADEAVEYVRSYHYIDDLRYACTYIRFHQQEKSRSQLRTALMSRGVSQSDIDAALEESYEGREDELIAKLLDKRHYDPETADDAERQRTFSFLLRRGFKASEIKKQMGLT